MKWLLVTALAWTLIMIALAVGAALIARDTATTGQGPLNPGNLESVRWMATGMERAAVQFGIGLALLAVLLGFATRTAFVEVAK